MATEGRATTGKGYEGVIFLRCPFYIYRNNAPLFLDRPHPTSAEPADKGS